MSSTNSKIEKFRGNVLAHWKKNGRHTLPWRKTTDPYRILISEVMLQQTQVERVIPYYGEFLRRFPTIRDLARSNLATVLLVWSGLGYNRRGKYLHDAAKHVASARAFPRSYEELRSLSGIGDYTAKAICVFAFNEPEILIETNIRTALIHHFFNDGHRKSIIDAELASVAGVVAAGQDPREWHWALMDYGAHLKKSGVRNNHRSASYVKQSKFEGSLRQVRGEILKAYIRRESLVAIKDRYTFLFDRAFSELSRESLIVSAQE